MGVKNLLASLGRTAEATAKANHGKALVVESEGFSPLAGSKKPEAAEDEKKSKPKAKSKAKQEEQREEA